MNLKYLLYLYLAEWFLLFPFNIRGVSYNFSQFRRTPSAFLAGISFSSSSASASIALVVFISRIFLEFHQINPDCLYPFFLPS